MQLCAATDKSPHQQDERCAHDASDEAGSVTSLIPAEGLSEIGRDDNAKGSSENEAFGFIRAARRNELGNHSGNKADKNFQRMLSMLLVPRLICCPANPRWPGQIKVRSGLRTTVGNPPPDNRKPRRRDKHRGSPLRSDIPTTMIVLQRHG